MLKKLRRKFIFIAMLSFAAALLVILGIINSVSFYIVLSNVDTRIEMLADEYSLLPEDLFPGMPEMFEDDFRRWFGRGGMSDEARYDSRFFTVTLNENGDVTAVDTGWIAATDAEEAAAMAQTLFSKNKTDGITGSYRYRAVQTAGGTVYIFLECSRELDTFHTFFTASCLAAAAGLCIVFVLVVVFSKVAIRPVAESYEK